jgi:hypothetical protein
MSELSKKELAKKILALANEIDRLKKERGDCPLFIIVRNQEMRDMVEQYVKANT